MHRKKILLLIGASMFCTVPALAQKTTVTATIVDPNGIPYANGSVSAQLVPAGVNNPTVNGAAINGFVGPAATDDNGRFSMDVFSNTSISPANTKWQFTVCNPGVASPLGFGNQCFTPAGITITGATQDVSTQMNAVAPVLTRLVGVRIFSGAPTGACTAGQLAVDSTTGTLYSCNGGVWQTVGGASSTGAGPPAGSCQPNQLYVDTTTGALYTCNGGTWTPAAGGGTGTVTGFSYAETGLDSVMSSTVTTPSTTPVLTQTAKNVAPGTALMGPYPGTGTSNPVFETSVLNNGAASPATATATPAAATSVAIFSVNTFSGVNPSTPAGFTNLATPQSGFGWFYENLASTTPVTPSSSFTTTSWAGTLAMLGGGITSVPHSNVSMTTCGTGCISGALGPVTGGNTIIVFARSSSAAGIPRDVSCRDTLGNSYQVVGVAPGPSGSNISHIVCMAQNAIAGTPTITVQTAVSFNWAQAVAFELAGTGAYYTGPNGPWTMRQFTPADLTSTTGALGFTKIQTQSAAGCTTQATSYSNCDVTVTWTVPFADANYYPVCSIKSTNMQASGGDGSTGDVPNAPIRSFTASAVVVAETTLAARALTNTNITVYCVGIHP